MEEEQIMNLERLIEELESYRGRHTEMITVYVPAEASLINTAKQIEQEKSTAVNIKSKNTRKNVLDALEKISRHLRLFKQTPPKGLAVFCGNISETEGQPDIKLWSFEPPVPLRIKIYRCDQTFLLDPLKEMLEAKDVYGLLVIDRKEATFGILEGKSVRKLKHMTSGVPGKMRAGGQCLSPDTEIVLKNGDIIKLKECEVNQALVSADFENKLFIPSWITDKWKRTKKSFKIKTKESYIIASGDHLFFLEENGVKKKPVSELKIGDKLLIKKEKKIGLSGILEVKESDKIEMIDISVENENFIANGFIVHNSSVRFERNTEIMAVEFYRKAAESMKDLFFNIKNLKGILIGGPGQTKETFIDQGQIITALKNKIIAVKDVSYTDETGLHELVEASQETLAKEAITKEKELLKTFFTMLATKPEKISYGEDDVRKALILGAVDKLYLSKDLDRHKLDELKKMAIDISSEVFFISTETNEGKQFKNLGGIGAILRYQID